MKHVIYKLTCRINGKAYIGTTVNLKTRLKSHAQSKYPIGRAIRKYGLENFSIDIIDGSNDKKIAFNQLEPHYISVFKTKGVGGYNLTNGGEGSSGFIQSPESRERSRQGSIGTKRSEESKLKMRLAKLRKTISAEHKLRISESNIGVKKSDSCKRLISEKLTGNKNFLGKTFTDEVKKHLSEINSKTWTVRNPDGIVITVTNMKSFCLENKLSNSAMSRVLSGKSEYHKGWTKS
jgi:group I intron endonuclease